MSPQYQAIWSGTVSFSLVAIPVRLVKAVRPGGMSFRLLHRADNSPLRRKMVCPRHGREIQPEEMVRGYELSPDHFINVTAAELASVAPERSRTIEIEEFIELGELDPAYLDRPYYLTPMKGGEKSYRLLAAVLEQAGKAGLARFVLAEREYLAAVAGRSGALVLHTLHYPDELARGNENEAYAIDPAVKKLAVETVERLSGVFDPAGFADARRERMLALAGEKAANAVTVDLAAGGEEDEGGPPDLMAILQEALNKVRNAK